MGLVTERRTALNGLQLSVSLLIPSVIVLLLYIIIGQAWCHEEQYCRRKASAITVAVLFDCRLSRGNYSEGERARSHIRLDR